jgi:hypothetical protein
MAAAREGGPLSCEDCHAPQPDGRDFAPIRFEQHCARCHRDRIDPGGAEEVPHGVQPGKLRDWAAAILLRRFLDDPALAASRKSAVPGRVPEAPPDWATGLALRVDAAMDALLTPGRGCLLCHDGDRTAIVPPEIPSNWLPKAHFDHKTHRVERCGNCHSEEGGTSALDVDVPGIGRCRDCHGEGRASAACATCHAYHPADAAAWR